MSAISKALGGAVRGASEPAAVDPALAKAYPVLSEFLTSHEVVDGKPRQTSTLIMVCEEGLFKAGLRERDRDVSLWVSAPTWGGVYQAMEKALNEPQVAWRRSPEDSKRFNQNRK